MSNTRTPYPTDVSDDEWAFVAPYLTLLPTDAGQRRHDRREVVNGVRYIVKTGAHWRMLPHDLPPWPVVYQQMRRWMSAGCFERVVHDLRVLLRRAAEPPSRRAAEPPSGRLSPPPRFWIAAPCNRPQRVGRGQGMTATSGAKAPKSTSPGIAGDSRG
jgi:transposase